MNPLILILNTEKEKEYALIDSGDGEKLERFGEVVVRRPDPQALWPQSLPIKEWLKADAEFPKNAEVTEDADGNAKKGAKTWTKKPSVPEKWEMNFGQLRFGMKLTPFKHTGLFPEQLSQWEFMRQALKDAWQMDNHAEISVLNLFAYTGGASMACAQERAMVTHVDASHGTVAWAKENAALSGLEEAPIRWIVDDALVFAKKELKRGKKYDGIIMDPPAFGRGAKGEIWKIEEKFIELIEVTTKLLSDKPVFFVLNGYSAGYSAIGYANALQAALDARGITVAGTFEAGELAIRGEANEKGIGGMLLPAGIFARWRALGARGMVK